MTKAALEALVNGLLPSGLPITAAGQHRPSMQAVIDEMYDAQSRGDVLAAVTAALSLVSGDQVFLIRSGQARLASAALFPTNPYTWPFPQFTTTTSSTAYVGPASPVITAYANGQKFQVKIHATSTGAATLNINGLGAKKIFTDPTTQAAADDLLLNQIYIFFYDSALDSSAGGFLMVGGSGGPEHFRGYFASLAALQAAIPSGNDGDYAFVDTGVGNEAEIYIWDTDDNDWVSGGVTVLPDASTTVKGVVEKAIQAEANAGTATGGTGAELFIGPAELLALAATFINQLTFSASPIILPLTASKFLRSGASKEPVSVDPATQAEMITGTSDVIPVTPKGAEDKRSIKLKSFSNSATGSSTIDCLGAQEVTVFYNTTVTGAITIALSNDSNLEVLNVIIPITGANIAITTPSTTRMARYSEVVSGDGWYQSTKILQVTSIAAADTHELSFKRASAGPTFKLLYDGPTRA